MDKWNNKPVYLCDPEKNESCSKEICHISGGTCRHTFNKAYEKKHATNQDKLAEMVRTMDVHKLAIFITNGIECQNCPAEKYCDQHTYTSEYGWSRVPDENEEILDCNQIFERWLKEGAE